MNTVDKDNSTDIWVCPHCRKVGEIMIIEDSVVKDDWKEILCGCLSCDELFIRRYKYVETIKLIRS